jgi:hypothetical protein
MQYMTIKMLFMTIKKFMSRKIKFMSIKMQYIPLKITQKAQWFSASVEPFDPALHYELIPFAQRLGIQDPSGHPQFWGYVNIEPDMSRRPGATDQAIQAMNTRRRERVAQLRDRVREQVGRQS